MSSASLRTSLEDYDSDYSVEYIPVKVNRHRNRRIESKALHGQGGFARIGLGGLGGGLGGLGGNNGFGSIGSLLYGNGGGGGLGGIYSGNRPIAPVYHSGSHYSSFRPGRLHCA